MTVYNTLKGRHQQSRRNKTANITKDDITSQHIANMSLSAQVISSFVIFAVLVERLCCNLPYKVCKLSSFSLIFSVLSARMGASFGVFKVHVKQPRHTYHSASACRISSK